MTDGLWSLLGMLAVGYVIYRYAKKRNRRTRRLGVLQGGKQTGQFSPTSNGPPDSYPGTFPQIAALSWPQGGCDSC